MQSSQSSLAMHSPTTPVMPAKELDTPTTLPTPPNTSHRTKRHQRRVTWTPSFSYHLFEPSSFSSPSRPSSPVKKSSSCVIKPILKHSPLPFACGDEDARPNEREQTPFPNDADSSSTYLSTPLSTILCSTSDLRDLVNAYSVLTARLRSAFAPGEASPDKPQTTPPSPRLSPNEILKPLRENASGLVKAMTRDLGRVMVDPFERTFPDEESGADSSLMDVDNDLLDNPEISLPSPQSTPVKPKERRQDGHTPGRTPLDANANGKKEKKRGMSAERVTYARDLCTTTHAVLRLLQLVFTEPLLYTQSELSPFSDEDLHLLFRGVIQIPFVGTLPTPNARKSHALAVMTIQINNLPTSVLSINPTTPFLLSSALLKAIQGELGKEGKRGARGDGMRAIHNLCQNAPEIYMGAFVADLVPALMKALVDPSLIVRTLAAHALAGVAMGLTRVEDEEVRRKAREVIVDALNATSPTSSSSTSAQKENVTSPNAKTTNTTPTKENPIFVALRTTLNATEPVQPAQGPAWALSVIASLLILLDRPVSINTSFSAIASSNANSAPEMKIARLLVYGMRHKKSTVRALVGIVWRVLVYLAFKDGERKVWLEDSISHHHGHHHRTTSQGTAQYWSTLKEYVDSSVGVSMVASVMVVGEHVDELEEDRVEDERKVDKVLDVLSCLVHRGDFGANDAIGMMKRLFEIPNALVGDKSKQNEVPTMPTPPFELTSLLAPSLFSPLPGLLSTPYEALHEVVNEILETQLPGYEDVPALTSGQIKCIAQDGVWEKWVQVWIGAVTGWLEKGARGRKDKIKDFVNVWRALLKMRVEYLLEKEGDIEGLALYATGIITGFADVPGANATLGRLTFLRTCWTKLLASIPLYTLASSADRMFTLLLHDQDDLITISSDPSSSLNSNPLPCGGAATTNPNGPTGQEGKKLWAAWCAEVVAVAADPTACVRELFKVVDSETGGEGRMDVWRAMGTRYIGVRGPWEGALALLEVPFESSYARLTPLEKDDFGLWEKTLAHVIALSADNGIPSSEIADLISSRLSSCIFPTYESYAPRLADVILSASPPSCAFGSSTELAELVNQTMMRAYPPPAGSETECRWMARSLIRFFLEDCEVECVLRMCEGAAAWIEDANGIWGEDDWEFDMLPMYEHFMLRLAQLPNTLETLKRIGDFVLSGFHRRTASAAVIDAFQTFWSSYSGDEVTEEIERCLWAVEHEGVLPPITTATTTGNDESATLATTLVDEGEDEVLPPSSPILDSPHASDDDDEEWTIPEDLVLYDNEPTEDALATTPLVVTTDLPSDSTPPTTPTRSTTALPSVEEEEATEAGPRTPIRSTTTLPDLDSEDEPQVAVAQPTTPVQSTKALPLPFSFAATPNPTTPKKPKSPFTPRTPITPKSTVKDKENVSPKLPRTGRVFSFPPPAYPVTPSVKRKKDVDDEGGRRRSSLKKPRLAEIIDLTREEEEEEEEPVEKEAQEAEPVCKLTTLHQAVDASIASSTPNPPATPRKRALMDAVEVPRVEELFGQTMRKLRPLPRRMAALRKTTSAPATTTTSTPKSQRTKACPSSPTPTQKEESSPGSPMKRRRRSKFFSSDAPVPAPILEEVDVPASDDSIILARERRKSKKSVPMPSSDDDPRVGQVTPHHLISPAIRRRRRLSSLAPLETDRESDDERDIGPPSSPTRQVALRRSMRKKKSVERLGSL